MPSPGITPREQRGWEPPAPDPPARSRARTWRRRGARRRWDHRVETWDTHLRSSAAFSLLLERVVAHASPTPADRVVDLGSGTGFLALALAPGVRSVIAVDQSEAMSRAVARRAGLEGGGNVYPVVGDLVTLDLPPGSVDLVVSSYALHHLSDTEKEALVSRARRWLTPGGRLVIADMMFGRGRTAHDRRVIASKVAALARKGPPGWWRIAKNAFRLGLRLGGELPSPPAFWEGALRASGFAEVSYEPVVAEAGVVSGWVPPARP